MSEQIANRVPATSKRLGESFCWGALLLVLSVPAAVASDLPAASQTEGTTLSSGRSVIANGGGNSTGGNFTINGAIGQADVDPLQPSTGGMFSITGGFWFTVSQTPGPLFGDGFEQPVSQLRQGELR